MSQDKQKLIRVMNNLKADYKAGKISEEKFRYYYTNYENKLREMNAASNIKGMQGKKPRSNNPNFSTRENDHKNRLENEKLVKKYIVDPKKNAGEKKINSSSNKGVYSIILVFAFIIAFSAGIGFGIFNFDFSNMSLSNAVATVEDTSFPNVAIVNTTTSTSSNTGDTSSDTSSSSYSESSSSQQSNSGSNSGGSVDSGGSDTSGGGSVDSGGSDTSGGSSEGATV
ncbi:endoglucanase [Methanobrevibacter sp. OttesenSCG-928-K11]|nr:endoglucanase [Methanobrevibacter sp. OttesenSCG-928-K11]